MSLNLGQFGGGSGGSSSPTLPAPGYFFPNDLLFEVWDPTNIDPRAGSSNLSLCTSWKMFYVPFNVTISRYRFQCDSIGTGTGVYVYAGMADSQGNLIFDIGRVNVTGAGQYGKGAANDPGTNLYDASHNPTNSVSLTPGWYLYAWGAEVASGSGLLFPQMGSFSSLWNEQINSDTNGISPIALRWAHSGSFDISGGHLPTTIGHTSGGTATEPMNITFFI